MLSGSLNNTKNKLENLIFNNYNGNTGFLLWLSSYCITCIFQQTVRAKYRFSLLTYEDTCEPAIQQLKISGLPSLVQAISNIVTKKLKQILFTMKYNFYLAHLTWTFIKSNTSCKSTHENIVMTIWNLLQKRKDCNR